MVSIKEAKIRNTYMNKCFKKSLKNLETEIPQGIPLNNDKVTAFLGKLFCTGFKTGINYNNKLEKDPVTLEQKTKDIKIEKTTREPRKPRDHRIYERLGVYEINEVLPYTVPKAFPKLKNEERPCKVYNGYAVHMDSLRYQTFKEKGLKCVKCGIEGKYFALERSNGGADNRYHFNLYALTKDEKEVLMTKDHIHPKCVGGANRIDNLQTMCTHCNVHKGHTEDQEKLKEFLKNP
jgi:5-methylcytosine-specific restriction endonuclease McrA